MEDFAGDGIWAPSDSANDAPVMRGRLEVLDNHVRLTLNRLDVREQLGQQASGVDDDAFTWPDLVGELRIGPSQGRQVRLFGVRPASWGLDEIAVGADYATIGHVAPSADQYIEAVMEYDWLRSWLAPPHLTDLEWSGGRQPLTIDLSDESLCEAQIDGARIAFRTHDRYQVGPYKAEIERDAHVKVWIDEPLSCREITSRFSRPLQNFLIVALGAPVQLTGLGLLPTPQPDHNLPVTAIVPVNQRAPVDDASPARVQSYGSNLILPADEFIPNCSTVVPGWFAAERTHKEAIIRLTAPAYARFMYLDNECAVVAQCLEALHHDLYSQRDLPLPTHRQRVQRIVDAVVAADDVPEADREWAAKILLSRNDKSWGAAVAELIARSGALGSKLAESLPNLADRVEAMRHSVSHPPRGSARVHRDDSARYRRMVAERYYVKELAAWVARVILLREAGFERAGDIASGKHNVQAAVTRLQTLLELQPDTDA